MTVIAYAVLVAATSAASEIDEPAELELLIPVVIFWALLLRGLWRGSRLAWGVALLAEFAALVATPFVATPWWLLVTNVAGLILLISRPTRAHVSERGALPAFEKTSHKWHHR